MICRKRLSFSALTQISMIWSYSVCGLCVDVCVCLCTTVSVIGFDLHCNCLGSSSMSLWPCVKHNKTLGLNFLTSDLDIWICIFFHIQVLWHIFIFLYGNKKTFSYVRTTCKLYGTYLISIMLLPVILLKLDWFECRWAPWLCKDGNLL